MKRATVLVAFVLAGAMAPAALAQTMSPRDVDALPASAPTAVESYGPDAMQIGELRIPKGKGPVPVAIVIHGGCWTKGFAQMRNTAALADALTRDGVATWNIEYRQVGEAGGGWPGTFQDWAAAADHLKALSRKYPLDLSRVITVGHSAGAHAALWLAARATLPATSPIRGAAPLSVRAAVAVDGPGDIAPFIGFDAEVCGKPVIVPLMGATPAEAPERYREASPFARLPLHVPQYLVSSEVLSAEAAENYRKTAAKGGDTVTVLAPRNGGHFDIIAPGTPPGAEVKAFIEKAIPAK